ncbi:hypothetical protein AYO21_04504 [Fonsecaea monophora]|uniref:Uncharacterized protein n=1 Tax=Fonsecaea monophora TaxID=254056 RepID=A0A177FCC9_9EURO|nr:hypothetical protein AYO21_04504 [Fonsecaea monophora]OAG41341.1 hypothetical protein AYO21_04504 [Fonsecaea monophora]
MEYTTQIFNVHDLWSLQNNMPLREGQQATKDGQEKLPIFLVSIDTMISTMHAIGKGTADKLKESLKTRPKTEFEEHKTFPKTEADKSHLKTIGKDLEGLKTTILRAQPNLNLEKTEWEIATVSALWLLIDLHYHSQQLCSTLSTTRLGDFQAEVLEKLKLELPERRKVKFNPGTGLPATIFVCAAEEGMVWGECKMRWSPFESVSNAFGKMRLDRLVGGLDSELDDKTNTLGAIWQDSKNIVHNPERSAKQQPPGRLARYDDRVKNSGFTPFDHGNEPGVAYRVRLDASKITFSPCSPCLKCYHLFNWGERTQASRNTFFSPNLNCAEDDVHMQIERRRQKSDEHGRTSGITPSLNNTEGRTSSPTTMTDT